jgi:hypothetical protein
VVLRSGSRSRRLSGWRPGLPVPRVVGQRRRPPCKHRPRPMPALGGALDLGPLTAGLGAGPHSPQRARELLRQLDARPVRGRVSLVKDTAPIPVPFPGIPDQPVLLVSFESYSFRAFATAPTLASRCQFGPDLAPPARSPPFCGILLGEHGTLPSARSTAATPKPAVPPAACSAAIPGDRRSQLH